MKTKVVTPALLAGGSGTRLWPLSRKSYPKQFSNIINDTSLFQQSALRFTSKLECDLEFAPPITLTNANYRFIVGEQLQEVGIVPGPILIEPEAKNTAPAILAASLLAFERDNDAILFVAPSDHVISDLNDFHASVRLGLDSVSLGSIVTFGIDPTGPDTAYGYIEVSTKTRDEVVDLVRFVEKPDAVEASRMLDTGRYLWNAGMFLFRASDMITAFELHAPEFLNPVRSALSHMTSDLDFLRLEKSAWSKCKDLSIDYAVMERAKNLKVVPLSCGWSDLGSWDAVLCEMPKDTNGVATTLNSHAFDCQNTLLRSESPSLELIGLGLKDIIAVAMPDAVLVAHKSQTQNLKNVLKQLKLENVPQADNFPIDYRPWGWFETLIISDRFQVKSIYVKPGASLSLQSHHHRSEHWIVVEGTATVTINDETKLVTEGQSVYIPLGSVHRMENPGKIPMVLIEVQTGTYLGEDDIIRYEDKYSRV